MSRSCDALHFLALKTVVVTVVTVVVPVVVVVTVVTVVVVVANPMYHWCKHRFGGSGSNGCYCGG